MTSSAYEPEAEVPIPNLHVRLVPGGDIPISLIADQSLGIGDFFLFASYEPYVT
jgi:hypothetical protein